MTSAAHDLDSVELAVISNRFEAAVLAMMNTLLRTSRSGVINNGRDFSCCVITGADELLAMAESQPIHVLSGPDLMAKAMKEHHPELRRGDAFLNNSPYHGNSHAADHTILVPVIDADGIHRFTVLAKAHQADCGNAVPTTYAAEARDVYEEGAPIFPCVRVQRGYSDVEDVIRMCRMRIRVPDQWWADYLALIGAGADRRTARARARRGARLERARGVHAGVVRLLRAPDGRGDPAPPRQRDRDQHRARSVPGGARRDPDHGGDQGAERRGPARDRPARQPRLPAVRPQPHRVDGANGRDARRVQRDRPRRAAERGQLPPAVGPGPGELRGRRAALPRELLGGDDQPRRPGRERRPARARRVVRRSRAGRGRAEPSGGLGRDQRHRPAPRWTAVHQPADPVRGDRRLGRPRCRRLAHARRHRRRRTAVPRQRRDRRAGAADPDPRTADRPRQRGAGAPAGARPPRTWSTDRSAPRWR